MSCPARSSANRLCPLTCDRSGNPRILGPVRRGKPGLPKPRAGQSRRHRNSAWQCQRISLPSRRRRRPKSHYQLPMGRPLRPSTRAFPLRSSTVRPRFRSSLCRLSTGPHHTRPMATRRSTRALRDPPVRTRCRCRHRPHRTCPRSATSSDRWTSSHRPRCLCRESTRNLRPRPDLSGLQPLGMGISPCRPLQISQPSAPAVWLAGMSKPVSISSSRGRTAVRRSPGHQSLFGAAPRCTTTHLSHHRRRIHSLPPSR